MVNIGHDLTPFCWFLNITSMALLYVNYLSVGHCGTAEFVHQLGTLTTVACVA